MVHRPPAVLTSPDDRNLLRRLCSIFPTTTTFLTHRIHIRIHTHLLTNHHHQPNHNHESNHRPIPPLTPSLQPALPPSSQRPARPLRREPHRARAARRRVWGTACSARVRTGSRVAGDGKGEGVAEYCECGAGVAAGGGGWKRRGTFFFFFDVFREMDGGCDGGGLGEFRGLNLFFLRNCRRS